MRLMHGTCSSNSSAIAVDGLLPRVVTGQNNWSLAHHQPSIENCVYLTSQDFNAEFFGIRAASIKGTSEFTVVVVEVDGNELIPDENFFIDGPCSAEEMRVAQQKAMLSPDLWQKCLEERGLVAHRGSIQSDKIVATITKHVEDSILDFLWAEDLLEHDAKWQTTLNIWRSYPLDWKNKSKRSLKRHPYFDGQWLYEGPEPPAGHLRITGSHF